MNRLLSFALVTLLVLGCQNTKSSAAANHTETCGTVVTFRSIGSGIDMPSYELLMKKIADQKLKFTEKNIGREGEKEICLPLTELKESHEVKKLASEGKYISVSVR
jgi:hypothetical protein